MAQALYTQPICVMVFTLANLFLDCSHTFCTSSQIEEPSNSRCRFLYQGKGKGGRWKRGKHRAHSRQKWWYWFRGGAPFCKPGSRHLVTPLCMTRFFEDDAIMTYFVFDVTCLGFFFRVFFFHSYPSKTPGRRWISGGHWRLSVKTQNFGILGITCVHDDTNTSLKNNQWVGLYFRTKRVICPVHKSHWEFWV